MDFYLASSDGGSCAADIHQAQEVQAQEEEGETCCAPVLQGTRPENTFHIAHRYILTTPSVWLAVRTVQKGPGCPKRVGRNPTAS
eukprot:3382869-Pyramimonas_sp.AAC.1